MNSEREELNARLKYLDNAIKAQKAKLELHGIFDADHKLTESELMDRWRELQSQLKANASDKNLHHKANLLEQEINKWMASTAFDFKR